VGFESVFQVVQDQAAQIPVVVDQRRPTLVARLLDEVIPQGDRQPCPGLVVGGEGGGAVVEEVLLPQVEEVDGDAVFSQMSETGIFSTRCCLSRATFFSGLKSRRY